MLPANGVVVDAGVKVREFDSNIDGGNGVGADQVNFGLVDVLRQFNGFLYQLDVQWVMVGFFAGQIDRHHRFAAFLPGLVLDHPHRARAFS
ncbi:hypothetical protein D3C81_1695940 [compost metagenome]